MKPFPLIIFIIIIALSAVIANRKQNMQIVAMQSELRRLDDCKADLGDVTKCFDAQKTLDTALVKNVIDLYAHIATNQQTKGNQ